jgi:hypothetical protein
MKWNRPELSAVMIAAALLSACKPHQVPQQMETRPQSDEAHKSTAMPEELGSSEMPEWTPEKLDWADKAFQADKQNARLMNNLGAAIVESAFSLQLFREDFSRVRILRRILGRPGDDATHRSAVLEMGKDYLYNAKQGNPMEDPFNTNHVQLTNYTPDLIATASANLAQAEELQKEIATRPNGPFDDIHLTYYPSPKGPPVDVFVKFLTK